MKKKATKEETTKAINEIAEKVRDDMDYQFRVAQSQMWIAENELVDALLTEEQRQAYKNYSEKKNDFFAIAKELYQRKF